jgi:hypothetical protein
MFDFFRRRTAKDFLEEAQETYGGLPEVTPVEVPQRDNVVYKIGKTENGKVTLSLGDYSGAVVTMTNSGVDQLIRMLEAAKEPETDIDPELTEEENV